VSIADDEGTCDEFLARFRDALAAVVWARFFVRPEH